MLYETATPNKALQLTANPLRGLSAAELGRYVATLEFATGSTAHSNSIDLVLTLRINTEK